MVTIFPGIIFVGFLFRYIFFHSCAASVCSERCAFVDGTMTESNAWPRFLSYAPYFSLDSNYYMRPCVCVCLCARQCSQTVNSTEKSDKNDLLYIASPVCTRTSCCIAAVRSFISR